MAGQSDKIKGKAKQVEGKVTGDKTKQAEGKLQKAKGEVESAAATVGRKIQRGIGRVQERMSRSGGRTKQNQRNQQKPRAKSTRKS